MTRINLTRSQKSFLTTIGLILGVSGICWLLHFLATHKPWGPYILMGFVGLVLFVALWQWVDEWFD